MSNINTISAVIQTDPSRSGIEVLFQWPYSQPDHTYTIEQGTLALELDRHNIARPAGLLWQPDRNVLANRCLVNCFGEEFHHSLMQIYDEGNDTTSMSLLRLEKPQRIEIAKLQHDSPATPPKLAKFIVSYLQENEHPLPNTDDFMY